MGVLRRSLDRRLQLFGYIGLPSTWTPLPRESRLFVAPAAEYSLNDHYATRYIFVHSCSLSFFPWQPLGSNTMNIKDLLQRLSGISTPIGGLNWTPSADERQVVYKLVQ